jgi:DNA-binding Lrp family transcriptional regulator
MRRAFVLVNSDLGSEIELQSELQKIEGVVGVHEVYGVYDLMVEIESASEQKLKDIIFSKIRALKHVRSTITLTAA